MVKIKFVKTHPDAILPTRNHENIGQGSSIVGGTHDSGYDIYSCKSTTIFADSSAVVPTGIQIAYITPGYWFRVESRSGLSFKHNLLAHCGIVDNQYRGDLGIKIYNHSQNEHYTFKEFERVAQLVVYPLIDCEVSWEEEVQETQRGKEGFGSSGK